MRRIIKPGEEKCFAPFDTSAALAAVQFFAKITRPGLCEIHPERFASFGDLRLGHAWIEVLVPGMQWVAIDPTNRQWTNERYVAVSFGRDFRDATPLRGTFKGSGGQAMKVRVHVKRRRDRAAA